jgi:glycosyltransferase involved in cell wall biosynthesis
MALLLPRVAALDHTVVVSTFSNLSGAPLTWENKYRVMPAGQDPFGADVIVAHWKTMPADLVITLMDCWPLNGPMLKDVPLACWAPIDTDKLGDADRRFFNDSGAIPIAMSRHGETVLRAAGYDPLYVPHAIDTGVFSPSPVKDEARERSGLAGKFVIGINAANKDAVRKSFFPQFEAFARFRKECPEAVLLVHTITAGPNAPDLRRMAEETGIIDAVKFSDQLRYLMGMFTAGDVAAWYNLLDVLSNPSMAEGFGLTPLEALACGVPTIVTAASAMPELSLGLAWQVDGEPFWNPTHNARWVTPSISMIVDRYRMAYEVANDPLQKASVALQAREKALEYDVDLVMAKYWRPVLNEIFSRLESRKPIVTASVNHVFEPSAVSE